MSLQRAKLGDIQYVASSAGSIYANPVSTKTFIKGFMFHNTNTTTETVKVYVVPDSSGSLGTAASSHLILNFALSPNDSLLVELPYSLTLTDTNDSLQAITTTASKVTVIVFGDKDA